MTAAIQSAAGYAETFARLEKSPNAAWFVPTRRAAMKRFNELGFPTTKDEEWRFTNVSALARTSFRPAPVVAVSLQEIGPYVVPEAYRLVFVNGRFTPALSSSDDGPVGFEVSSLASAMQAGAPALRAHLAQYARFDAQSFTALNTALAEDGVFLHIPRGQVIERPVQILFVSTGGAEPTVSHPRNLMLIGEGSQVTLIESYAGLGEIAGFTNAVTELVVGENAVVYHYRVQQESEQTFHIGTQQFHQSRSSTLSSLSIALGGALVRNDVTAILDGEGAECTLNGLYMMNGTQHVDNHLRVEHAKPHCNSWEYYKGILDGAARGVFTGRIVVHKDAQKTDAKQTNMNLLLSEEAQIDTKPQLEIFADDVKCTHGATIGQIDADALFYLRARGISEETARSMLIFAFANESLGQIRIESIRAQVQEVMFSRLPGGARLKGAI